MGLIQTQLPKIFAKKYLQASPVAGPISKFTQPKKGPFCPIPKKRPTQKPHAPNVPSISANLEYKPTQDSYKRVLEKTNLVLSCERVYAAALGPSELVLGTLLSKNLKIEPNTLTLR